MEDFFFGEFCPEEPVEGLLLSLSPLAMARRVLKSLPPPKWIKEDPPVIKCLYPLDQTILEKISRCMSGYPELEVETRLVNPPQKNPFNLAGLCVSFDFQRPADIYLRRGQAFGSGIHPSTKLAAAALRDLAPLEGQMVLDVGTGTGILALVARRLGARIIVALEPNLLAIKEARENFLLNREQGAIIPLAGYLSAIRGEFQLVVANLVPAVLVTSAPKLSRLTRGYLVISGFREKHRQEILKCFSPFRLIKEYGLKGWLAAILRRCQAPCFSSSARE
ncbi:50S ribosomal protein L11 methyltransferase [Thermosulfuriphilus sp.]